LAQPAWLFWLSSYVACRHLAVAPQSGAKHQFYRTVYNITLNQIFVAQKVLKNLKKIWKKELKIKINAYLNVIFLKLF